MYYRFFVVCSLLVCLGVAGYLGFHGIYRPWRQESLRQAKEDELRGQLPFESLRDRLPTGKALPARPLASGVAKRWTDADRQVEDQQGERAHLLKSLHDKSRKFFVESPGFGVRRMKRLFPSDEEFMLDWRSKSPPAEQPGPPANFPISAGEAVAPVKPGQAHFAHHLQRVVDFVYATGFGFIKDRDQVAGFKPHGFRGRMHNLPTISGWKIDHILLVGVLQHEQPVVYLSTKLPSMEHVSRLRTRSLDSFESLGLAALRTGEDLYLLGTGDTVRMLGALRATTQCQKCHDAECGDLLGAFSYTLRLDPR